MTAPTTAGTQTSASRPLRYDSVRSAVQTSRRKLLALAVTWVVLLAAGLGVPWVVGLYDLQLAVQGATLAILALSVGWLLRQTGQLSFGHAAFSGVSGYSAAILSTQLGLDTGIALLLGIAFATAFGFVVACLIVRLPGITFAMLTLAVGMLVWVASTQLRPLTNGFDGLLVDFSGTFFGQQASAYTNPVVAWPLVWVLMMVIVAALWAVSRTVFGRRLTMVRENEERTRFAGHGTYWPRVLAFTVSCGIAGIAGAFQVLNLAFISPEQLFFDKSGLPLIVAVIGGISSVAGPVVGAFVFIFVQSWLSGTAWYQIAIGAALMLVVVIAPGGGADVVKRVAAWIRRRGEGKKDHA